MSHTITQEDLEFWLSEEEWHQFACSHGVGTNKRFDVSSPSGLLRVKDHGKVVYEGTDRAAAVAAYNSAR